MCQENSSNVVIAEHKIYDHMQSSITINKKIHSVSVCATVSSMKMYNIFMSNICVSLSVHIEMEDAEKVVCRVE